MQRELCVQPFINIVRGIFAEGGSFQESLKTIRSFQEKMTGLVLSISPNLRIPHILAVNMITLTAIAGLEYIRAHGLNFPATENILSPFAGACFSASDSDDGDKDGGGPSPDLATNEARIIDIMTGR